MPSNKPRINFVLSDEELSIVEQFMEQNGIKNQSRAVRALIALGITEYKNVMSRKEYQRFDLSAPAAALVDDFESMNQQGKKLVQQVVDAAVILFPDQPELMASSALPVHGTKSLIRNMMEERDKAKALADGR